MHRDVIPGRDDLTGLPLGLVPGWGDIGIRALEDGQRVEPGDRAPALRIGLARWPSSVP